MNVCAPQKTEELVLPTGIRRATLADIPFIFDLTQRKYPGRVVPDSIKWFHWCLDRKDKLVLVGSSSVGMVSATWRYGAEQTAIVDMLASHSRRGAILETLRMLRMMLTWAHKRGITAPMRLDADTGVDFAPFAKRLGGNPVTITRYEIPVGEVDE